MIYSIVIHFRVRVWVGVYGFLFFFYVQDVGFQHGKLLFTGWARGDIIENMLKDHRSADYTDSKKTDVSVSEIRLNQFRMQNQS